MGLRLSSLKDDPELVRTERLKKNNQNKKKNAPKLVGSPYTRSDKQQRKEAGPEGNTVTVQHANELRDQENAALHERRASFYAQRNMFHLHAQR